MVLYFGGGEMVSFAFRSPLSATRARLIRGTQRLLRLFYDRRERIADRGSRKTISSHPPIPPPADDKNANHYQ